MADTQELLQAQEDGAQIVCAVPPYEGWEMNYDPRRADDSQPWAPRSFGNGWRYASEECCAVTVQEAPAVSRPLGRRQVEAMDHLFDQGPLQLGRWALHTLSETHRVLSSLATRGLVYSWVMPRGRYRAVTAYALTKSGRETVRARRHAEEVRTARMAAR